MLQAATTAWVTTDVPVDAAALKDRAQEGLQDKAVLKSGLDPAKHGSKRDLAVRAGVSRTAIWVGLPGDCVCACQREA